MTSKLELVNNVKEWIKLDDTLKKLQREAREHKERKKHLTNNLIEIMKTNEIDCFDINNGKLLFCKNKIKSPLTKKSLLLSLQKYFSEIPEINYDDVGQFIFENREILIKENIKRK